MMITHLASPRLAQEAPPPPAAEVGEACTSGPDDEVEVKGPTQQEIEQIVTQHERAWRQALSGQKGRSVVGITCAEGTAMAGPNSWLDDYARSVLDSGGEVRLLYPSRAPLEDQMRSVDALLVPGGADVDPSFYNMKKGAGMENSYTNPRMDAFEIGCLQFAYRKKSPVLGICRGEQLMNVAGGGTLIQDIPSEYTPNAIVRVNHQGGYRPYQLMAVLPGSRLHANFGEIMVAANSVHHQAIGNLSPLFYVTAVAMDNIVEGIERKGVPSQQGVQGHPEQARHYDARYQRLFDNLVEDGSTYHNKLGRRILESISGIWKAAR